MPFVPDPGCPKGTTKGTGKGETPEVPPTKGGGKKPRGGRGGGNGGGKNPKGGRGGGKGGEGEKEVQSPKKTPKQKTPEQEARAVAFLNSVKLHKDNYV